MVIHACPTDVLETSAEHLFVYFCCGVAGLDKFDNSILKKKMYIYMYICMLKFVSYFLQFSFCIIKISLFQSVVSTFVKITYSFSFLSCFASG